VEGREPLAKEKVGAFKAPDVSRPPLTSLGQGCLGRLHELVDGLFARLYAAPAPKEKRQRNRDRVDYDYIQPAQIPLLLAAAEGHPRDHAMLSIFATLGLRSNELRMLDRSDIRWDTDELVVRHAKGGKQRLLPLEPVKASLERWLGQREEAGTEAVFISRGPRFTRLSNRQIRTLVKRYGRAAGVGEQIPQGLHPHALRHTVATTMLKAGVDLRVIQEFLGHSSPAVTAFYASVDLSMKREALSAVAKAAMQTITAPEVAAAVEAAA
jgi:integrase